MLYTNIKKMFDIRGIKSPYKFLKENGFKKSTAYNVSALRFTHLRLEVIEKLCIFLSCSPNDLLEWQPNPGTNLPDSHPLQALKPAATFNFEEFAKDIPVSQMPEFIQAIETAKQNLKK
jgi:DNA-binding Xre family transcriptional regulator